MDAATAETRRARMLARLGPMPPEIAGAMARVPRHRFVPETYLSRAYDDEPIPLPFGEATVSAPHMVALQLEYAALSPGLRVLEIGAGYGYLAALIAELVGPTGAVHTVEIEPTLAREASRRLADWPGPVPVHVRAGDGRQGWPEAAPFDRIIVSCAVPLLPSKWKEQLAPQGLLVAPVGDALGQRLARWHPSREGGSWEYGVGCRFVPLRSVLPSDI